MIEDKLDFERLLRLYLTQDHKIKINVVGENNDVVPIKQR